MALRLFPAAAGVAAVTLLVGAACSSNTGAAGPAASTGGSSQSSQSSAAVQSVAKPGQRYSTPDLVKATQPAVVRIQTQSGVGTGFFVSSDGYIMTNNHVVASTRGVAYSSVQVTMDDGTVKTGQVVGTDVKSDLALVKVDGSNFPALKFATLENTNVGDDVLAIGYALDLGNGVASPGSPTVTEGIVSAKNRAIQESQVDASTGVNILGSIQTDAAINHGNSGGPLLNFNGDVVGINTSLVPDQETGGTATGIGLAVGADTANAVFQQLKDTGKVNRGLLGVQFFQSIKAAKAKQLGVPADTLGIYLPTSQDMQTAGTRTTGGSVQAGGPADVGGLKAGDVITKIADVTVHDESELAVALIQHHPGEKVSVEYYRNGQKQTTTVTLGTP